MSDGSARSRSLEAALRAHARGKAAHPGLALPVTEFAAHALRCAKSRLARRGDEPTDSALADAIESSDAPDLFLASAGVAGVPDSWERIQAVHAERLVALARSRGAGAAEAEQQVQELWSDLAVARPGTGRAPPLAQYDGTGRLFAWLATCLLRRLAARAKSAASRPTVPEGASVPTARASDHPVASAERRELAAALGGAIRRSVDGLTTQERAALVFSHRDGWSGKEVARLLGVGAPRASRLRARATEKLRSAIVPLLRAQGVDRPSDGSWEALRDAVAGALAAVAIPPRDLPPRMEDPSVPAPDHG